MFKDTNRISVLNYNENCVCVNIAPGKSIKFDPSNYSEPTLIPLTIDEIRFINNGFAFKIGMLEFPEEIEDELYKELRIDKEKVLKLREIREILLHPTKDGLTKIVSIESISNFDRVRAQFHKLKMDGHKLTLDVADIVERRGKELLRNKIKSEIQIGDPDIQYNTEEVNDLKKQLAEMQLMMAKLLAEKDTNTEDAEEKTKKTTTAKKTGKTKKSE